MLKRVLRRAEPLAYAAMAELGRARRRVDRVETIDLATMMKSAPPGQVLRRNLVRLSPPRPTAPTLDVVPGTPGCWVGEGHFIPLAPDEGGIYAGLYDRDGHVIRESSLVRGVDRRVLVERSRVPNEYATFDEPVIYAGRVRRHFGHFLTEAVARLWYALDERPDLRIAVHGGPALQTPFINQYLSALGIPVSRFVIPTVPTQFAEVHVPEQTWIEGRLIYTRHAELGHAVARAVLQSNAPSATGQPLFLARRQVPGKARGAYGERPLVRRVRAHGVRVIYPEDLDFAEQIRLVNGHRTIVGQIGSAHHLSLMALQPRHHVYLCAAPVANFVMIDYALGNRAHYVACNRRVPSLMKRGATMVDLPFAMSQLRDLGVLATRP